MNLIKGFAENGFKRVSQDESGMDFYNPKGAVLISVKFNKVIK